jgi:uncharacterized protein involved in exopolysaccharide biosynthesis
LYLWSRRIFIAKIMVCAVILFAVILLAIPRRYKAMATVIIAPPRFSSEVRAEPLSVTTARNILSTGELAQQIIDRLTAAKRLVDQAVRSGGRAKGIETLASMPASTIEQVYGADKPLARYVAELSVTELEVLADASASDLADLTVDDLGRALSTEEIVEKKTAADIKVSPLIRLFAVADSGGMAQILANTWADLFEAKYISLTSEKTRRQYDSILMLQRDSLREYEDVQTSIVQFKARHNLDLYKKQIDEYTARYREFTNQLLLKRNAMLAEMRKLTRQYEILEALQQDGVWVGTVDVLGETLQHSTAPLEFTLPPRGGYEDATGSAPAQDEPVLQPGTLVAGAAVTTGGAAAEPDAQTLALYRDLRTKAIETRNKLSDAMVAMRQFYQLFPIELMESERNRLLKEYESLLTRLRNSEVQLEVLNRSIAELDNQISGTSRTLVLRKELPDQSVVEAMARPELQRALNERAYVHEIINPGWSKLIEARARLIEERETARAEVNRLRDCLPDKERELQELQIRLYRGRFREATAKMNLEQWQRANRELFDTFVETNTDVHNSAREIALLREEVQQLELDCSMTKALADYFQQQYDSASAELQVLETRQKAVQKNVDLILEKLQAAQSAVTAEISDVSLAARAVTPARHYFPPRTLLLVTLTLMTFLVLIGLLARNRYMEIRGA